MPLDNTIAMLGLSAEQSKKIFLLVCEEKKLEMEIVQNFISLSSEETLFCMGAQATGYEKIASGHPDYITVYDTILHSEEEKVKEFDEAIDPLCKRAGESWLETNSMLFQHALEYEAKLNEFIAESENAIQAQVDHIWMVVTGVMEDTGVPVSHGLGIAIHLVDSLPSIPADMVFHTLAPLLTSIGLEVYANDRYCVP